MKVNNPAEFGNSPEFNNVQAMQQNLAESLRLLSQSAQQVLSDEKTLKTPTMHIQSSKTTPPQNPSLLNHLQQQQLFQATKLHGMQQYWSAHLKSTNKLAVDLYNQNCLSTQANAGAMAFLPPMMTPPLYTTFGAGAQPITNQTQVFPTDVRALALFQQNTSKATVHKRKHEDVSAEPKKGNNQGETEGKPKKRYNSRKFMKETKGASGERGISKPKRKKGETDGNGEEKRTFSSKYRGVYWNRECQAWRARLWHDKKSQHIGNFKSEIEAARAFDKRAREVGRKELNFPRQGSE